MAATKKARQRISYGELSPHFDVVVARLVLSLSRAPLRQTREKQNLEISKAALWHLLGEISITSNCCEIAVLQNLLTSSPVLENEKSTQGGHGLGVNGLAIDSERNVL